MSAYSKRLASLADSDASLRLKHSLYRHTLEGKTQWAALGRPGMSLLANWYARLMMGDLRYIQGQGKLNDKGTTVNALVTGGPKYPGPYWFIVGTVSLDSSGLVEGTIGLIIGLVVAADVGDDIVVGEDIVLVAERDLLRFCNKINVIARTIRTKMTTPPTAPPMTAELFDFLEGDGSNVGDVCTDDDDDDDVVGSGLLEVN
jgi:hypothetical protein